jgi:hypothetical protein
MKTIKESTNPRSLTVRPDLDGPDQYFLNNRPVAEYRTASPTSPAPHKQPKP